MPTNRWPTLGVCRTDGRLTIDNAAAEQAIRPLAIGRKNRLHIAGEGGLTPAAELRSVTASAKRHGLNPWSYLRDVLDRLGGRSAGDDVGDLLPDVWAIRHARTT